VINLEIKEILIIGGIILGIITAISFFIIVLPTMICATNGNIACMSKGITNILMWGINKELAPFNLMVFFSQIPLIGIFLVIVVIFFLILKRN
jgi:hypothetical protein